MSKFTIALLGVGHTNAEIVHKWSHAPIPNCRLVCISKFAYSTYSGLLPGTLAGQFEPREMEIQLAPLCQRAGAELILAEVTQLETANQSLIFADAEPLYFDAMSVGVGSMPSGWQSFHSALLVPIKPMQTFLQRLDARLETAQRELSRPLRILIVGGGVAGVEISLCLRTRLAQRHADRSASIQILTSGEEIAGGLHSRSVRKLHRILSSREIDVTTNARVETFVENGVLTSDGRLHAADCVIWCTGAAAPRILSRLGLPTDERGFLATRSTLQTTADLPIFAVGDSGTITAHPSPKAGVYAVRQAPILWHNLRAIRTGDPLIEYRPQSDFLKILNTGDGKALLEYKWLSFYSRWCWSLKTRIDKKFLAPFQQASS